uniref:Uncharacterized family 31 glucosidase KIAA1161-like n=1 Tax=Phallusia mammillata TaxID=59560 RepID=A0A6F9DFY8_9ASCI|nr:uncharacterized family 31 glucosidase KIAA1161-like [Phallusia mammillata]
MAPGKSGSSIVKFSSLSSANRDDMNLIESEDGEIGEEINGGRAHLEFRFPPSSTNNGTSSHQSNDKEEPSEQRRKRSQRWRVRALLIILACIIITVLLLVWHFYNLQHFLEIRDKYRKVAKFNAETRYMSVLDKQGNLAAEFLLDSKGAVSGDLQYMHACNEPSETSSCLHWAHKNTSLSLTAFGFGDEDDIDKMHCIKVEWKMQSTTTPVDCVDLTVAPDDKVVWFGAHNYITYPHANMDSCDDPMLQYIPGGFSVKNPFGTILQNKGGSVIEPMWISSTGVVIKASTHHAVRVSEQVCKNGTNPQICLSSAPDDSHQSLHHDNDGFHMDYMVCVGDSLHAAHQETIEHFIKPLSQKHTVPEYFQDMTNDGAYFEGDVEKSIIGSIKPSDLPSTLHSQCSWLVEKPLWNIIIHDNDFATPSIEAHLQSLRKFGGTVHLSDIAQVYDKLGDFVLRNDVEVSMDNFTSVAKKSGFKIMLPFTPFVNYDTKHFNKAAMSGYLIFDEDQSVPSLTRLTTHEKTLFPGVIDLTNENASSWFINEITNFNTRAPVDYFHMFYGQSTWIPNHYRLSRPLHNPGHFSTLYADVAFKIGRCTVTDVAYDSQIRHQFVLLSPSQSMKETVSSALAAGLGGYPFFIPTFPCPLHEALKHMRPEAVQNGFIRWIQLVAFFPVMHIPWDYNTMINAGMNVDELTEMIQKYTDLRNSTTVHGIFEKAFLEAETNSTKPVLTPMWMAPNALNQRTNADEKQRILLLDDQFMIGTDLCVAPILEMDATKRDIYLPPGIWKDILTSQSFDIKYSKWIKNYKAEIGNIPVFVRV